jgi:hypothetical protein
MSRLMTKKLTISDIESKVQKIKEIQMRRVGRGDTLHSVGDALALDVDEAEYLLSLINKLTGVNSGY